MLSFNFSLKEIVSSNEILRASQEGKGWWMVVKIWGVTKGVLGADVSVNSSSRLFGNCSI